MSEIMIKRRDIEGSSYSIKNGWISDYNIEDFPLLSITAAAAAAKSLQSFPTLCDPMDSNPPGSYVHEIL